MVWYRLPVWKKGKLKKTRKKTELAIVKVGKLHTSTVQNAKWQDMQFADNHLKAKKETLRFNGTVWETNVLY